MNENLAGNGEGRTRKFLNFPSQYLYDTMTDNEDPELKRLRMQKMQRILQQKKQAEQATKHRPPNTEQKMEQLLTVLLSPDAKQYLDRLKSQDSTTYYKIRQQLFPPHVMRELDLLMTYYARGMIRRHVISRTEIRYLERKVKGIGSSITIKKQGEDAKSLGDFLKDEEE